MSIPDPSSHCRPLCTAEGDETPASYTMRTPTMVTMGHAFGVSDERVRSTRRRYAETWPIFFARLKEEGK